MPTFHYEAMTSSGQLVKNEIEAASTDDAIGKIRQLGYFPTNIRQKATKAKKGGAGEGARPTRKRAASFGKVKSKHLTLFTRQFAVLQEAGLPIVRSLKILEGQLKPGVLKNALMDVTEDVEAGSALSEALGKHPRAFDKLYINMIKAGEAGGVLDQTLARLADFREKAQRLKRKIVGAMIYPVAVVTVATLIVAGIMYFVIPSFEAMFVEMDLELPGLTVFLLSISRLIQKYVWAIPVVPISAFIAFKVISKNRAGRYMIDSVKMKIPIFGMIISKSTISRFCRTLGTLISSGVPILDALNIVRDTAGNVVVANAIGRVHDAIREGDSIATPLGHTKIFDPMVVNMIDVGEETGELDKMLMRVADNYDDEVDTAVEGMMSLLEPMIIVGLGVSVGTIVIALILPLISLMQGIE